MGHSTWHRLHQSIGPLKSRLKPYLRYAILSGTLLFVGKAFIDRWQEILLIRVSPTGWGILLLAFGITLLSLMFAGWVWLWLLQEFDRPMRVTWGIRVFLKTNIAKYLPGNIWHFWGRISEAKDAGISPGVATLSVLLEPLLMAADGLLIAIVGLPTDHRGLQIFSVAIILILIHPSILNPCVRYVSQMKGLDRKQAVDDPSPLLTNTIPNIKRYPLVPILGEILFLVLRGSGFLLTIIALTPIDLTDIPYLFSVFCFAYVLGLVVPGAPGGVGIFEATAIALLNHQFPPAIIISSVALYRVISILAEISGATLAWLHEPKQAEN